MDADLANIIRTAWKHASAASAAAGLRRALGIVRMRDETGLKSHGIPHRPQEQQLRLRRIALVDGLLALDDATLLATMRSGVPPASYRLAAQADYVIHGGKASPLDRTTNPGQLHDWTAPTGLLGALSRLLSGILSAVRRRP